ncbi:MAG: PfkB family carbohydrate kinase [Spirochaetota bacterium]
MILSFPPERPLACITIGRANLDLYPPEGQALACARSYRAFVGGSPANIAAGLVKRGLKAGIITKVADDGIGHFVAGYLRDFGVDTAQILFEDSFARTSLAFAERRRKAETVFYRQEPSDLLLEPKNINAEYIAAAQVLFLSGTALCCEPCRSAVQTAINAAQKSGTIVAMDIDYRPHGWADSADKILQTFAGQCDLLIGTAEEFAIASGAVGPKAATEDAAFLRLFPAARLLVVKRGKEGANAYLRGGETVRGAVLPAALKKPWGAGDAFASSLLASLLLGKSLGDSMQDAAAAASLNISGLSCTEAMPDSAEIADFLYRYHHHQLPPEWVD